MSVVCHCYHNHTQFQHVVSPDSVGVGSAVQLEGKIVVFVGGGVHSCAGVSGTGFHTDEGFGAGLTSWLVVVDQNVEIVVPLLYPLVLVVYCFGFGGVGSVA